MKNLFILLCFLLLSSHVNAQESSTLHGLVTASDNNEPLIGVNIFLDERWDIGTTTNLNGTFSLQILEESRNDSIIFSYLGHREVKLALNQIKFEEMLNIKLVQNIKTIDEVVVKAERLIAEEFTFKKLRKIEIYKNPSAKADPLLAVNSMPAATTVDESANISLRGSGPEETGIFFNNVPIYDAVRFSQLNGIGTFSIFNTSIVKSLDVFPGNPPLEYGNTTSGLISISSDEHIPRENSYNLALSLANISLSANLKANENASLTVFSNYNPSGIITGINRKALNRIEKFNSNDLGIHYFRRLNSHTQLKVFNYSIIESYVFNMKAPSYVGTFNQNKKRNFTIANFRKSNGKSEISVNGGMSFSNANYQYSKSIFGVGNQDIFASINYQYFGDKLAVKTGFSYDGREQGFDGSLAQYGYAIGASHPFIEVSSQENANVIEYFGYLKYYLNEKWIVGSGFRKNIANSHQKKYLSSQLNIFHQANQVWSFKASIGKYNKYTFAQNQGSNNFLITTQQADINFNKKGRKLEHNLAVFWKHTDFGNKKNKVLGVEYFLAGKITKDLKGRISYTYLNARITDNQASYPSKYDLNYFAKGNLEYQLKRNWTISTSFLFRQGSYFLPIIGANYLQKLDAYQPTLSATNEGIRYPDYKLIDLSISRIIPVSEDLTIIAFANLNNVFDFNNVRGYDYNTDYSQATQSSYSRRLIYFGALFNF